MITTDFRAVPNLTEKRTQDHEIHCRRSAKWASALLASASDLTRRMCGVMITERVNQTRASAQDPFVSSLVVRISTLALKPASLAVEVEVRSLNFLSPVFFGRKKKESIPVTMMPLI